MVCPPSLYVGAWLGGGMGSRAMDDTPSVALYQTELSLFCLISAKVLSGKDARVLK